MTGRHLSPANWTSSHTGRRHSTDAGRLAPPRSCYNLRHLIGASLASARIAEFRGNLERVERLATERDALRVEQGIARRNAAALRRFMARRDVAMRRAA